MKSTEKDSELACLKKKTLGPFCELLVWYFCDAFHDTRSPVGHQYISVLPLDMESTDSDIQLIPNHFYNSEWVGEK